MYLLQRITNNSYIILQQEIGIYLCEHNIFITLTNIGDLINLFTVIIV